MQQRSHQIVNCRSCCDTVLPCTRQGPRQHSAELSKHSSLILVDPLLSCWARTESCCSICLAQRCFNWQDAVTADSRWRSLQQACQQVMVQHALRADITCVLSMQARSVHAAQLSMQVYSTLRLTSYHDVHRCCVFCCCRCNTGMIGEEGGRALIKFMDSQGYATSPSGFKCVALLLVSACVLCWSNTVGHSVP
jgi:hypothetical protein